MSNQLPSPVPPVPDRTPAVNGAAARPPGYRGALESEVSGSGIGTPFRRYLDAVLRRKWIVLLALVAGVGAGVAAMRTVRPDYAAQATIWIEGSPRQESQRGPIQSGQLLQSSAWRDLLDSYTVLDHVALERKLYLGLASWSEADLFSNFELQEEFRPGRYRLRITDGGRRLVLQTPDGALIDEVAAGDSLGLPVGFSWVPPARALGTDRVVDFWIDHPRDAANQLRRLLRVHLPRDANFMRLELRGKDPEALAATVNAVARRYVEVAAELKGAKVNELAAILGEQLAYAEQNLREAEIALESFRVSTITLPTERASPVAPGLAETRGPAFTNFFNLKVEQEQLRRDRDAIASALNATRDSALSVAAFEVIPSVRASSELMGALQELANKRAELRALRYRYTDEHPPVQQLAADVQMLESRSIPRLAYQLMSQISSREAQINALIQSAASELEQIPTRALEEARLQRQVATAEDLYIRLRQRYEEARLAAASAIPDVSILDEARAPEQPVGDSRMQVLLGFIFAGLGIGIAIAIVMDRMDPRVRYPEDITLGLSLPILGSIPYIKGRGGRLDPDEAVQVVEAFRELRLSVSHAYGGTTPLVLTITSPGSGDGKTFIASNLALSFAELGHPTLLIDADTRRGNLHRVLGGTRRPGLTDLLVGEATREAVIQKQTTHPSLHLIGCGTWRKGSAELLGSPVMSQLLTELRSVYSVIIVDSPPLGAGVDPFILGTLTGTLVVALRTGYTDREFAGSKLSLLERLPVRVLGAIFNAVPPGGLHRYYYPYLSGYEERDEDAVAGATTAGTGLLMGGG